MNHTAIVRLIFGKPVASRRLCSSFRAPIHSGLRAYCARLKIPDYSIDFGVDEAVIEAARGSSPVSEQPRINGEERMSLGIYCRKSAGSNEFLGAGYAMLMYNWDTSNCYIAEIGFVPGYEYSRP